MADHAQYHAQRQYIAVEHQRTHQQRVVEGQEGPAQPAVLQAPGQHVGRADQDHQQHGAGRASPQAGAVQRRLGVLQHQVRRGARGGAQPQRHGAPALEAALRRLAVHDQQGVADGRAGQVVEGQGQRQLRPALDLDAGGGDAFDQRLAAHAVGEQLAHAVQGAPGHEQQRVHVGVEQVQPQSQRQRQQGQRPCGRAGLGQHAWPVAGEVEDAGEGDGEKQQEREPEPGEQLHDEQGDGYDGGGRVTHRLRRAREGPGSD